MCFYLAGALRGTRRNNSDLSVNYFLCLATRPLCQEWSDHYHEPMFNERIFSASGRGKAAFQVRSPAPQRKRSTWLYLVIFP